MKRISWDELATIYDKSHSGRPARTLQMNTIFDWAVATGKFIEDNEGYLCYKPKGMNTTCPCSGPKENE